jgi:CRP/FNR family cyclic AMP-dependent transcriptional regulator
MDSHRLTAIPVFSDLSPQEANRLAAFATETSAAAGETLIKEGDFSVELLAIEEGTADVIHSGQRIASLGPGDLIGEMGLLERRPRSADVIASSPMRLIKLTHWEIRRMSPDTVNRIKEMIDQRRRSDVAAPGRRGRADATHHSG